MNKKLLTLAVGAALGLGSAVAQAKVTVYGHAQVEVGSQEISRTGGLGPNLVDGTFTEDQKRGRLGVMSAEKLGNGMTAIAKFEWSIDTTVGGQSSGNRESLVGLKGSFGTIELGNLRTPYKYWGGVSYDPFVASNLEARSRGGMTGNNVLINNYLNAFIAGSSIWGDNSYGQHGFVENSVAYKSPNWNGFQVWGVYSFDELSDPAVGNKPVADGDYSLGVRYKNGPFEIGAVANNNSALRPGFNPTQLEADGYKFFGQYKWGNHTFSGQYETIDTDFGAAGSYETDAWFVGYQLRAGNNTFVVNFGATDVDTGAVGIDVTSDYYTIAMIHHLSKKTRLFGGYSNQEVSSGASTTEEDVWSLGLRVIF